MTLKIAKFKLGQVVEVVAAGWGLSPALIGATCTITTIHRLKEHVEYKVEGLTDNPALMSNSIWEESFKAIELTTGEQAGLIADKMAAINTTIEKLKAEHAGLLEELLALVDID